MAISSAASADKAQAVAVELEALGVKAAVFQADQGDAALFARLVADVGANAGSKNSDRTS